MGKPNLPTLLLAAGLAFSLFHPLKLPAQGPEPVYVCFEFRQRDLQVREGPGDKYQEVERDLNQSLKETIAEARFYQHWSYEACRDEGFPRLAIWPEGNLTWDLHIDFIRQENGTPVGTWHTTLFEPGDIPRIGGLPRGSDSWRHWLVQAFEDALRDNGAEMRLAIANHAPLGTVIAQADPPTFAILPLDWQAHNELANSRFRIQFRSPEGNVRIVSKGRETCRKYPAEPPFTGILVKHLTWLEDEGEIDIEERLSDLGGLTPRRFYLQKFEHNEDPWCDDVE